MTLPNTPFGQTRASLPGAPTSNHRRLDLVVFGASPCVAMPRRSAPSAGRAPHTHEQITLLASPCARPCMAESCKRATCLELQGGGSQRHLVLAAEVGDSSSSARHQPDRALGAEAVGMRVRGPCVGARRASWPEPPPAALGRGLPT